MVSLTGQALFAFRQVQMHTTGPIDNSTKIYYRCQYLKTNHVIVSKAIAI
jgi:hypothetical protein